MDQTTQKVPRGTFEFVNTDPFQRDRVEKKYAVTAVNAVAAATAQPWQKVFQSLVAQTHETGLLPEEPVCVKGMLRANGFFQQPGHKESWTAQQICDYMSEHCRDGQVAVVKQDRYNWRGFALAIVPGEQGYRILGTEDRSTWPVEEIWIRWADGQDHSPVRRRSGSGKRKDSQRKIPEDHAAFHYFQANPVDRVTGDCVIRGVAAACDMTWHEAMDRLAEHWYVTVNYDDVFSKVLAEEGFVKYTIPRGSMVSGMEFCRQMTEKYHNGQRIFASMGTTHVVAVLPFEEEGRQIYRIVDTWDSTKRRITEYWVQHAKPVAPVSQAPRIYRPGDRLLHPAFGEGQVSKVTAGKSYTILEVAFPDKGTRVLVSSWVDENCRRVG